MIFTRLAIFRYAPVINLTRLQFFLKTSDADVGRYLKLFTMLPLEQIEQLLGDHSVSDT